MKHFWVGSVDNATRNIVWESSKYVGYSYEYIGDYYVYIQNKYGDYFNITSLIEINITNKQITTLKVIKKQLWRQDSPASKQNKIRNAAAVLK